MAGEQLTYKTWKNESMGEHNVDKGSRAETFR